MFLFSKILLLKHNYLRDDEASERFNCSQESKPMLNVWIAKCREYVTEKHVLKSKKKWVVFFLYKNNTILQLTETNGIYLVYIEGNEKINWIVEINWHAFFVKNFLSSYQNWYIENFSEEN